MENMFEEANKKRRKKIIEENIDTAEEVLNSGKHKENFLLQKPVEKIKRTINLNKDVDDFYNELCKVTGLTRTSIMENILEIAILENKEIQELSRDNKKVNSIVEKYKKIKGW